MNRVCRSEPISFLRLERYLLDELNTQEREELQAHLQECSACHACFETLRSERVSLAPLRLTPLPGQVVRLTAPAKRWSSRLTVPLMAAAAGLAAAAAVLIFHRPGPTELEFPAQHVRVKGGELAIELVREHEGDIALDTSRFAPGDRWEARVSCPSGDAPRWELVVFQGGETFFPLQASVPLQCGNHLTLPGAFTLTGHRSARVCVVLSTQGAVERTGLSRTLPVTSACVELTPVDDAR